MANQNQINLRDVVKQEYKRCFEDPVYFMKKYVKIQHPQKGTLLFDLWDFQEDTLNQICKFDYNIILKSRQLGITTLVSAYALWLMVFRSDKNILCVSIKQDTSKEIITRVSFAHENLPSWLRIPYTENNKLSLRLKNGSQIKATSSSGDAGRSSSTSLLIIDECAFIENIEPIWASAQQTLATGGKAIVLSTPNGVGNFFHKIWVASEAGENKFNTIRIPWTLHPERNQAWRDEQTKLLGERLASQECFSEDVIVYTKLGPKKISDITTNDFVLTHKGNFKKVKRLFNKIGKVYNISSNHNFISKYVTGNHPFYLPIGEWRGVDRIKQNEEIVSFPNNLEINSKCNVLDLYKIIQPKYFKKVLCNDDTKFYINDRKHKIVHNRFLKIDYDFGRLIGLYLAEGSGFRLRKVFNFNYSDELNSWPNHLQNIVKDKFGVENYQIRNIDNTGHLSFCSEVISYCIDLFVYGKDCYSKQLTKFAYDNLNVEFIRGVIDGTFRGDGCVKEIYPKTLSSTSKNLIYDISYLLRLFGIHNFSVRKIKDGGNIGQIDDRKFIDSPSWGITIRKSCGLCIHEISDIKSLLLDQNNTTTLNITPKEEEILVYNIEVENDNSYVTEYGVVHNCDCNFESSGNTVVQIDTINWYKTNTVKEPIEKRWVDRGYWIWEYPNYNKKYIVSADVARGDGTDKSAFHVIDIEKLEQVAEYDGQIGTKTYGNMLVAAANEYNKAILIVENNNMGWATLQQIIDLNYPNTFYSSADLQYVDVEQQMTGKINAMEKKMVPGFSTTTKTRPLIISKLESYLRDKQVLIRSTRLIEELLVFIWNNGKAEALKGYNDDLITSLGIGFWVRDTSLRLQTDSAEFNKHLLDNISRTQTDAVILSGADERARKSWSMPLSVGNKVIGKQAPGAREDMDLRWLL